MNLDEIEPKSDGTWWNWTWNSKPKTNKYDEITLHQNLKLKIDRAWWNQTRNSKPAPKTDEIESET